MLVIRLQRTGRRNHAMFRVVVQDSRRSPTSGKVVDWLGDYDPHTKKLTVDHTKAQYYLSHGAQPSPRLIRLLKEDKVNLPKWVSPPAKLIKAIRHPEKRRSTRPPEAASPTPLAKDQTAEAQAIVEETAKDEATEPAGPNQPEGQASEAEAPTEAEPTETDQPAKKD